MAHQFLRFFYRILFAMGNLPRIKPIQRLRGHYYSHLLGACGKNLKLGPGAHIRNPSLVSIGNDCYLGEDVQLYAWGEKITLGNNVLIAAGARLISRNHAFENMDAPISSQGYVNEPIVIEDDVWIGFNVIVLAGIRIGKGSIIGANSVVTKDVEPYSIMGGTPARLIRQRS